MMQQFKNILKSAFNRTLIIHISCWIIFITYELSVLYFSLGKLEQIHIYVFFYMLNILFFYALVKLFSVTFFNAKPKYVKGILVYLAIFIIYVLLKFLLEHILETPGMNFTEQIKHSRIILSTTSFRGFYFTILATFYTAPGYISYYRNQAFESERLQLISLKEKAELELRLGESRNAYLKQQINPHMLFNTLNFIYNNVYKYSADASNCILLLSDIMRFSLEETDIDGKVPLSDEIKQVKNLVEINRYRYDPYLNLDLQMGDEFGLQRIIPLILLTLTENLFKHGKLNDPYNPAKLQVTVDDSGHLLYFCRNLKKSKSDYPANHSIGLHNVRIRLDFSYPGKYSIVISESEEFYELTLNLSL